jgi:hypothetical protein
MTSEHKKRGKSKEKQYHAPLKWFRPKN